MNWHPVGAPLRVRPACRGENARHGSLIRLNIQLQSGCCQASFSSMHSIDWPALIRRGARVFLSSGSSVPQALLASLVASADKLTDVEIICLHYPAEPYWLDAKWDGHLQANSFFLTPAFAEAVQRGQAVYTPCPLSEIGSLFSSGILELDVALIQVSPPDEQGYCSLGLACDVTIEAVAASKLVIAQVNAEVPRSCGENLLHISSFGAVYYHDEALQVTAPTLHGEVHAKVASYAAQLVEDGATLQVGFGRTPAAVLCALQQHRHLGVHSNVFNDELMLLMQCGACDNSQKSLHVGKSVCAHAQGSKALHEFVAGNRNLLFMRSGWVCDPQVIASNHAMTAINGALQIDLSGQIVRDEKGHAYHGGIGALQDFMRGVRWSKKGRSLIVLPSLSDDGQHSRIVFDHAAGSAIAVPRTDVEYVVSEYGIANLRGLSVRQRVAKMVDIAHPRFREELLKGAREVGWLPKFYTIPASETTASHSSADCSSFSIAGRKFMLRPLKPSDDAMLQEFFYSHVEETVRMRYGHFKERMTPQQAYRLTAVDQSNDLALAVFECFEDCQKISAVGRFYRDMQGESAEVAFVTHENARKLGLASRLLEAMATYARQRGIHYFWASVLRTNRSMCKLFVQNAAVRTYNSDDDCYEFRLDLSSNPQL